MSTAVNRKDQRFEFRTSSANRELFVRAADAAGMSISAFANDELEVAALRVLADRTSFVLTAEQAKAWEALNDRPARDLPGLREFLTKPSIFVDG